VGRALGDKGIPNRVDDWGARYDHDWPTWWEMLPLYLDDLVP
jgi:esterase/lipase superfamily enzyme